MPWRSVLSLCAGVLFGCKTGRNYPELSSPRYAGSASPRSEPAHGDTMRVVSYNIEFSQEVQGAIRELRTRPALRDADVVLLQEMTAPGARTIADSLQMSFVYYPAIYNTVFRRDVGNAVLSRWPILADEKLILPAHSRYAKTQRVATAATIRFRDQDIRVYSTHLGTPADMGRAGRAEQLGFILKDAERFTHVVLGGDMNSKDIGEVAVAARYAWPTRDIPKSNAFGRLDHVFVRGLVPVGAGTVTTPPNISDHRPIWAAVLTRE
jgi:endonuclease/exonuclease/phosphatase family metal-dependent hydrolase